MGRCLSPCLGDLDPNLYRRRLDEALRLFVADAAADAPGRPLLDARRAADARGARRAALRARRVAAPAAARLRVGARAARRRARGDPRPAAAAAARRTRPTADLDGFWIVGGRLVDWGPVGDGELDQIEARTAAALARGGRIGELGAHVPPGEVDEVRILGDVAGIASRHAAAGAAPGARRERALRGVRGARRSAGERELDDERPDLVGADGDR